MLNKLANKRKAVPKKPRDVKATWEYVKRQIETEQLYREQKPTIKVNYKSL